MDDGYFIIIPSMVRADKTLSASAKLLFGEIYSKVGNTGYCWAKNEFFADALGCDDRTVRRYLKELEEAKYLRIDLTRTSIGTDRKIYIIKGADESVHRGRTKVSTGGGQDSPEGRTDLSTGTDVFVRWGADEPVHHNIELTNIINDMIKRKKIKKTVPAIAGRILLGNETEIFKDHVQVFEAFYLKNFGTKYRWSPVDFPKIININKSIVSKFKENYPDKLDFSIKQITTGFEVILQTAFSDNWLKANFTTSIIDTKFNQIYHLLKNGKSQQSTGQPAATHQTAYDAINKKFAK
jgi:hypothetical protein